MTALQRLHIMIRVLILVLFAVTGWCKGQEKFKPCDTLELISSDRLHSSVKINHGSNHYPLNPLSEDHSFYAPDRGGINQSLVNTFSQRKKTVSEQYPLVGYTTGLWCPLGRNRILGPHPSFGIMVANWSGRWLLELEMEFRFVKAAHDYRVLYKDSVETTHQYGGGFFGVHLGYGVVNFKTTSVYLLCGLGYEGITAIKEDDLHDDYLSINSMNVNAGIGLHCFQKKGGFWGLELLYNVTNYCNHGGTQLDGNGVTIRFTIGFISDD